jgi:hypothetical protein
MAKPRFVGTSGSSRSAVLSFVMARGALGLDRTRRRFSRTKHDYWRGRNKRGVSP